MPDPDYYDILGVTRDASADDVRRAHRVLCRQYHPDVAPQGGDAEHFAVVQRAYEVLSDSDQRRRYDSRLSILRGERKGPGNRRPAKVPCAVCANPVYTFELKLHLGRRICLACFRRRKAGGPRLQFSRWSEVAARIAVFQARARTSALLWIGLTLPIIAGAGWFAWTRNHRPARPHPGRLVDPEPSASQSTPPDTSQSATLAQ
ncbi:MAG TPA: DnaJ domain-containing protein [Tepidisphaeraceae bacterium]|nr:DnaJ domain-containing protein [Tepidisphaeraceae bacterium]